MSLESNQLPPSRDMVSIEHTWKLEDIFKTDKLWEQTLEDVESIIPTIKVYEGIISNNPKSLFECLTLIDSISYDIERLYVYANMRLHEDGNNSYYQSLADIAQATLTKFSSEAAFIEPEILTMSKETIDNYIDKFPSLELYKHYLYKLLDKKNHILDGSTEKLLSQVSDLAKSPSNIYAMFNNADITFPPIKDENNNEVPVTHGRFIRFLESDNRNIRKSAFYSVYNTYDSFKNMLATTFASNIKQADFFASVRNYENTLTASLSRSRVPISVYDNLLNTVNNNLNLMHRYIDIRKELLELDELHMYDLYTPIIKDIDKTITYDEAWDTIIQALSPLGDEYLDLLKQARSNRWIDIYENKGKRSGAYSWGAYGTHPYVLLNYNNNLNSMFTLAHEMGHAIHTHYSNTNQPYIYAGYTIFVAEVASTVNEAILIRYLLQNATDKNEKAYLINYFLEQFRGTLYRQTMFAEFEAKIHNEYEKTKALTVDSISGIYYDLVKKYHGSNMVVNPEISMEWARIPHFYTPFYVYQYATGFSAAIAISQRILTEGEPAVKDYIEFLKGGSSKDPIDLLKIAGVDMSSPEPIEKAFVVFEDLLNQLSSL